MSNPPKSTVEEIRARFDREVDRFSNLQTGQVATVDAALCLDIVSTAAAAAVPQARLALDVGCGAGNYSLSLRRRLPELRFTLIDLSLPMLDRAKERLGSAVESSRQADVRQTDFPAGSFDIIVTSAMLHHLRTPPEWEQVFGKFHCWLKAGGGLFVFDLVSHEDPAIQEVMWERYGEYLVGLGGPAYRADTFAYIEREDTPTPITYQLELLRRTGFERVDVLHKNSCFAAYSALKSK